jgi:hypothetical protein
MTKPAWDAVERIAALIEKAISPAASVVHNVRLPVLGTKRTRQWDVVITFGQPPRQTIAIVEVQKRKAKPDQTTFHGWLKKKEQVGAQQLFCVSERGYPKSIIEEVATRIGPTVRLMTLSELESSKGLGGVFMLPYHTHVSPTYRIIEVGPIGIEGQRIAFKELPMQSSDRSFSSDGVAPQLTLDEIICRSLNASGAASPDPGVQTALADLVLGDEQLWLHRPEGTFKISKWTIRVESTYEYRTAPIPITNLVYRQQPDGDALAWVGSSTISLDGEDHEFSVVFRVNEHGYLTVTAGARPVPTNKIG